MRKLPAGWVELPLSEIVASRSGNSKLIKGTLLKEPQGDSFPAYSASGQDVWMDHAEHEGEAIIVSAVGARCGKAFLASGRWSAVANTHIIFPDRDLVDQRWLWFRLNDENFWERGGSAQPFVKVSKSLESVIPLPPLPEQRRIVAKVDALTARTARTRTDLSRIPTLTARYKHRLLALAFSGELTAGWRAANGIPPAQFMPVAKLCLTITDGDHQAPPRADDGVPFITISAMNNGEIDLSKANRRVPQAYFDGLKASRRATTGDVLFSVTGSIGIAALVRNDTQFVFQRHIAILKPDPQYISGEFLRFMLESPDVKAQCLAIATGTAQLTVPLGGLRNFSLPLPAKAEQAEIVRRIESAFGWLDRMAADHAVAARLIPKLDAAILTKAFRGDLVPQDPTDEPASVLLERIRAERAATPRPKRGRAIDAGMIDMKATATVTVSATATRAGSARMPKSRQDDDVRGQPYLACKLRGSPHADVQTLFRAADLPVADFYKQLAWEIGAGHIIDSAETLKAA